MPTPNPGSPVRGSTTGRPLMAALDLLGRRWTLRILWELRDGPLGFRELQERCDDMSSSVLSERLRDLHAAQILTRDGDRHAPTDLGYQLHASLGPLDAWATRWASSTLGDVPTGKPKGPTRK